MNTRLAIFLTISVVSVALFGFFAMGHEAGHGTCVARTLQGRACADTDILGVASYHISAFEKAMRAIATDAYLSVVSALALLLVFLVTPGLLNGRESRAEFISLARAAGFYTPQKFLLRRWASLKENSPNPD